MTFLTYWSDFCDLFTTIEILQKRNIYILIHTYYTVIKTQGGFDNNAPPFLPGILPLPNKMSLLEEITAEKKAESEDVQRAVKKAVYYEKIGLGG